MKIGSLFSGYGGLDLGVIAALGGEVAWHVEFDDAPSRILAHHWPDVPNYGDVTSVDWPTVEPVDVLTGGFPCQDVSLAGRRAGLKDGTRSGLWSEFAKAIHELRPGLVVIENVRGLLSAAADSDMEPCPWCVGDNESEPCLRALGAVLGDLADLGYDTRRVGLRAADAGAPHGRFRVFILASDASRGRGRWWPVTPGDGQAEGTDLEADRADTRAHGAPPAYASDHGHERSRIAWDGRVGSSDERESSADSNRGELREQAGGAPSEEAGPRGSDGSGDSDRVRTDLNWGPYLPAIQRWERKLGRLAPPPTAADGRNGQHRLNSRFVEWMMGLEPGHVTDPAIGLTRAQQLKALGNGVVPQQASLAIRLLTADV